MDFCMSVRDGVPRLTLNRDSSWSPAARRRSGGLFQHSAGLGERETALPARAQLMLCSFGQEEHRPKGLDGVSFELSRSTPHNCRQNITRRVFHARFAVNLVRHGRFRRRRRFPFLRIRLRFGRRMGLLRALRVGERSRHARAAVERDLYFKPGPFTKVIARERRNRGG